MSYLFNVNSLPVGGDLSLGTEVPTGTGATARSLRTRFGDVIYAADFGVQANGSSDDTAAWGNAFAAATGTGKYIVIAPAGVSVISTITIPVGVTVRGWTRANSYLGAAVTTILGSAFKKGSGSNSMVLTSFSTVSNDDRGGGVENMSFIGDGTHHGVTLANGIPYNFHGCLFTNCNAGIEGNTTNTGSGFATAMIQDCVFGYNTIGVWNIGDGRISFCGFNGNSVGVQFDNGASDNIVAHNKIEFNSSNGIQVDTTEDNILSANILDSNGASNIRWTNNRNGVITGNIMRNLADDVTMSGNHLYLSGNTDTTVVGNSTKFDATSGTTPVNAVGGGANTSVMMIGNTWRGHSGATAINAAVTGLTTTGNLT